MHIIALVDSFFLSYSVDPRIEFEQLLYSIQESELVSVCAVLRNILERTTADISSPFVFNFSAPNLASQCSMIDIIIPLWCS